MTSWSKRELAKIEALKARVDAAHSWLEDRVWEEERRAEAELRARTYGPPVPERIRERWRQEFAAETRKRALELVTDPNKLLERLKARSAVKEALG